MLSVIILILKILGIVIAAILGLALFVILLVLFVPIRYRGKAQKGEEIQAEITISWLLGIILFRVKYTAEKTKYALRICGYKLFSDEPKKKRSRRKRKEKEKQPQRNNKRKEPVSRELPVQKEQEFIIEEEHMDEEQMEEKQKKQKVSFSMRIKSFVQKIKSIKQKIRDMLTLIKGILRKIGTVKKFLFDYENRPGFKVLWKEVKALLHHIKPTRFSAYVHFGMEDPCQTGQILGAVCAICPQVLAKVNLNPDFEQQVLEGDLQAKGRIRMFVLLRILVRVISNKEVKVVWKHAKRLKEEL